MLDLRFPRKLLAHAFLAYSLALKVEAECPSKTSADSCWTTWCHISEDSGLHYKSYVTIMKRKIPERDPGCVCRVGRHPGHGFRLSCLAMCDYEAMQMSRNGVYEFTEYFYVLYACCTHQNHKNSCHNRFLSALGEYQHVLPLC
jgi:hypothetical protein